MWVFIRVFFNNFNLSNGIRWVFDVFYFCVRIKITKSDYPIFRLNRWQREFPNKFCVHLVLGARSTCSPTEHIIDSSISFWVKLPSTSSSDGTCMSAPPITFWKDLSKEISPNKAIHPFETSINHLADANGINGTIQCPLKNHLSHTLINSSTSKEQISPNGHFMWTQTGASHSQRQQHQPSWTNEYKMKWNKINRIVVSRRVYNVLSSAQLSEHQTSTITQWCDTQLTGRRLNENRRKKSRLNLNRAFRTAWNCENKILF